jgi:hypothetical protein
MAGAQWADRKGLEINPSFWHCEEDPGRYDGREIWSIALRVTPAGRPDEHRVHVRNRSFLLKGPLPPYPPGDRLTFSGIYRAAGRPEDPGHVELTRFRLERHFSRKRSYMYAVSAAALMLVVLLFLRAFRIHLPQGAIRRA